MNIAYRFKLSAIFGGLVLFLTSPLLVAEEHAPYCSYEGEEGPEH